MTKTELCREMKSYAGGGFITRKKLADFIGVKDAHHVDKYLNGLDNVNNKYYFINDVAEALIRS